MRPFKRHLGRLPIRRIGVALAWVVVLLGAATTVNMVGISMVGDVHT